MPILVHTPKADYGLSTRCLQGELNISAFNAAAATGYNILGEVIPGGTPPPSCYSGPNFIIVTTAGGALLRLSCVTGFPPHANRTKFVTVSEVGGNNLQIVDANGAAISGGTVINAGSASFAYVNNTWFALHGS